MKKSMAKVLASALSLAMAVTLVTPTDAAAASAPKFVKTYGKLYSNAVYSVKNVKKGYKVKVSVSGTAKSAVTPTKKGKKVSTIKATGSTVKFTAAVKASEATAGKGATVKVVVYNTKGKKVKTLSDGIRVMAHATGISVTAPETVGLNTDTQLTTSVTPSYATDEVTYTVDPADGATVSSTGVFNATKVGEYKVTASVNGITSEAVTVKAQAMMKSVKLTKPNTVEIAFDTDMSAAKPAVNKDNVKITNKDASVAQPVKKVTLSKDGMTATVETFANFVNDKNYEVTYNGQTLSLAAKIGEPASVVVTGKTIKYSTETEIDFKVLDANGVELKDKESSTYVTFEAKDANGNAKGYINGTKITLFNIGDTAQVTATYHTGKYENGKEVTFQSEPATYTAAEKLDISGTVSAYTLSNATVFSKVDFTTIDKYMFVGETETLVVKGKDANGNDINSITNGAEFSYETADPSVAIVNGKKITAVKEGTAVIKVNYGTSSTVVELTVAKEAIASSIAIDKQNVVLSNKVSEGGINANKVTEDAITVQVTVKDQFGQKIDLANNSDDVKVEAIEDYSKVKAATYDTTKGKGKVTFSTKTKNDSVYADKGTYKFKITSRKLSTNVTVDVKSPENTNVEYYQLQLDTDSVDTGVNEDPNGTLAAKDVNVKIAGYNKDKVKVTIEDAPDNATGSDQQLRVTKPDNKTVATNSAISVLSIDPSNKVTKELGAGTYTVSYYDGKADTYKESSVEKRCYPATFTVKDTQDGGQIVVKKNTMTKTETTTAATYKGIVEFVAKHILPYDVTNTEVDFGSDITGVTINGKTDVNVVGLSDGKDAPATTDKQVYINTVTVNETIKVGVKSYTVPVTYTVNQTISINQ